MLGRPPSTLISPVACESKFHVGAKLVATRFMSLKCPVCGCYWDVLMCGPCHDRLTTQGLKCKCGEHSRADAWIDFDAPIGGPVVAKK